ncbi:E3 ubiquitin-protein ligase RNF5-like isoform X2 [Aquila chrysaetos chrysaetos]|uniref:E3 ubiquitin-protein ligase RNF5-like isoform X2 n=1 Tax=Aquila chrysaetos chrysaetos TaxID=223781 RepID=UPI001176DE3F|nr:E3 ubiquitin-protein ligase RNF5-like isoform X2 [Aquila chrysaetos chrysaetos]
MAIGWRMGVGCGTVDGLGRGALMPGPPFAAGPACTSRDTVVPLYGRDSARRDPRLETPPRPRGQRPEPETQGVPPAGPGSSFHVAFGFGAFPFAFFSTVPQPPPTGTGDAGDPPAGSLDSVFLFIAAAFFLWLLSV